MLFDVSKVMINAHAQTFSHSHAHTLFAYTHINFIHTHAANKKDFVPSVQSHSVSLAHNIRTVTMIITYDIPLLNIEILAMDDAF